jgi:hypothetical protein
MSLDSMSKLNPVHLKTQLHPHSSHADPGKIKSPGRSGALKATPCQTG